MKIIIAGNDFDYGELSAIAVPEGDTPGGVPGERFVVEVWDYAGEPEFVDVDGDSFSVERFEGTWVSPDDPGIVDTSLAAFANKRLDVILPLAAGWSWHIVWHELYPLKIDRIDMIRPDGTEVSVFNDTSQAGLLFCAAVERHILSEDYSQAKEFIDEAWINAHRLLGVEDEAPLPPDVRV